MTPLVIPFSDEYLNRAVIGAVVLVVGVILLLILPGVLAQPWETVLDVLLIAAAASVVVPTAAMWRRHQNGEPALLVDETLVTVSLGLRPRTIPIRDIATVTPAGKGVIVETDDGNRYPIPVRPLGGELSPEGLAIALEEAIRR